MLLRHREKFIIPLIYQNTYKDVCTQLKNNQCFRAVKELQETELHAFINRRFWQEETGHCEVFAIDANYGRDVLLTLYDTEQNIDVEFIDIRFYVFQSGIMFLVVSAVYQNGKDGVSLYAAEETNAALKDLYVHKKRFLVYDKNLRLEEAPEGALFQNTYGCLKKNGTADDNGRLQITLSSNEKAKEKLSVNTCVQLFKNKDTGEFITFEDGYFVPVKNKNNMIKCYRQEEFCLLTVCEKVVGKLDISFGDYFAGSKNGVFPKKAVIFNMHVLENEKELSVKEQLFYLAHGYTHSYKYAGEADAVFSAFDNSYWKITREGVANINLIEMADGDKFLYQEFENRFDTIYLWIFLLVLHQYYGLQYFTCRLLLVYQESLRVEKENAGKEYARLLGQMEEIKSNGDLFLLEYTFADISQISHQNDIYAQFCKVYNVKGLIEDYKTNAGICDKILEKKRQKSLQKRVNFIAVISTFFTLFTAITQTFMGLFEIGTTFSYILRVLLGVAGIGLVVIGLLKNK